MASRNAMTTQTKGGSGLNYHECFQCERHEANATVVRNTVIFAINVKQVEVVIVPALYDLNNTVKRGQ